MRHSWVVITALFAVMTAPPASANVLISVDKSAQSLTVTVDGAHRYTWPVSTGRAGYDTPSGSFRTFRMEEDHFSKEFDDAPMPHSIFFTRQGHAIHGSYDKRLGLAVSHGCVRLSPAHAATLFALVKEEGLSNTKVVLTGSAPAAAPLVAKRRPRQTQPQDDDEEAAYAPRGNAPYYGQQPVWGQPAYGQQGYPPVTEQPRPRWPFPFFN